MKGKEKKSSTNIQYATDQELADAAA